MQDLIGIGLILLIVAIVFVFEPHIDKLLDGIGDTKDE